MKFVPLVFGLLVTACGADRPAAPTAEEAARLDRAEAMLDNRADKEKGREIALPAPSNRSD